MATCKLPQQTKYLCTFSCQPVQDWGCCNMPTFTPWRPMLVGCSRSRLGASAQQSSRSVIGHTSAAREVAHKHNPIGSPMLICMARRRVAAPPTPGMHSSPPGRQLVCPKPPLSPVAAGPCSNRIAMGACPADQQSGVKMLGDMMHHCLEPGPSHIPPPHSLFHHSLPRRTTSPPKTSSHSRPPICLPSSLPVHNQQPQRPLS